MDRDGAFSVSDKVSMCNYQANQLCCEAADTAMQVHGGIDTRVISPSNIFTDTTDGIELPREPMKFKSDVSPVISLDLWGRESPKASVNGAGRRV